MTSLNIVREQPESAIYSGAPWRAFLKEMEGRIYGDAETRDAWVWFLSGYKASVKQIGRTP